MTDRNLSESTKVEQHQDATPAQAESSSTASKQQTSAAESIRVDHDAVIRAAQAATAHGNSIASNNTSSSTISEPAGTLQVPNTHIPAQLFLGLTAHPDTHPAHHASRSQRSAQGPRMEQSTMQFVLVWSRRSGSQGKS